AGISFASTSGTLVFDGGTVQSNGASGIAVGGSGNTLVVTGGVLRSEFSNEGTALALLDGAGASVFLADTTINFSHWGIRVGDNSVAVFNGGDDAGSWGRNTLDNQQSGGAEIWDARTASGRPDLLLERTRSIHGTPPPPGTVITGDDATYGIKMDGGNRIRF
ncbi:MAG TPA: hypothetical protein VND93_15865, partial [Myxococcales bacterium]|nr:hypothetical protein [Myxococcales bacterium]